MKDTLRKLRALVTMKGSIINALMDEQKQMSLKIAHLQDRVQTLELESQWWKAQDDDVEKKAALERHMTAVERDYGSYGPENRYIQVPVTVTKKETTS